MKTPQAKINKHALNTFDTYKDFEKFLQNVYGKDSDTIRSKGFYPSIDNVAVDGILYTIEEYDMDGRTIALYNKRIDIRMEIETEDRYKNGWHDAKVTVYKDYGAWRNDIRYLD